MIDESLNKILCKLPIEYFGEVYFRCKNVPVKFGRVHEHSSRKIIPHHRIKSVSVPVEVIGVEVWSEVPFSLC